MQHLETQELSGEWSLDEELSDYINEYPFYLHDMMFQKREDLIERLADSQSRNLSELLEAKDHNSALLLAVKLDIVEALLEAGADLM